MAKRAGKISTGGFICSKKIKSKEAKLVITASDASDNTKKAAADSCRYYKVKYIETASMAELGKYTGSSSGRAVVSVNDNNFAKAILDRLN